MKLSATKLAMIICNKAKWVSEKKHKEDPLREMKMEPLTGVETIEETMELIEYPTVPEKVMQELASATGEIPSIVWSYTTKRGVQT